MTAPPEYIVRRIGNEKRELLTAELIIRERGLPFSPATPQFVWVATDRSGVVLGAATADPEVEPTVHDGEGALTCRPHAEFREMAVIEAAQRRGIGTALCRARMIDLAAWGSRSVSAVPAHVGPRSACFSASVLSAQRLVRTRRACGWLGWKTYIERPILTTLGSR